MKTIYQILAFSLISVFIFSACGEEELVKNSEKAKYELTFNIKYNGTKEVKQVRAALFDYATSVQNDVPTGAPSSALSFPTEALTTGGVDFTKDVSVKLEGLEGKEYLVVIYGDIDTNDGRLSVNSIDPVYMLTNFKPTEDKAFDIELKDQKQDTNVCSKEHPNGTCEDGKVCNNGGCETETTCTPNCSTDNKVCGDDGCGGSCGTCETGKTCSTDQLSCEATTKSYEMNITVNYSGTKEIKRIGIAGYDNDSYSGMPTYAHFIDGPITFPYTFTLDPTQEGTFKLSSDYNGNFYIWLYGDVDGTGFQPGNDDPQVKFMVVMPNENITETVEILDL